MQKKTMTHKLHDSFRIKKTRNLRLNKGYTECQNDIESKVLKNKITIQDGRTKQRLGGQDDVNSIFSSTDES